MARAQHHGVTDQAKASHHRRDDARVLFGSARWRGSMYVGGYAVECLVKASLMGQFRCRTLAELDEELKDRGLIALNTTMYTHQFESLFRVSGHLNRLRADPKLWSAFTIVNRWNPAWRYDPNSASWEDAEDFFEALDLIIDWVRANI